MARTGSGLDIVKQTYEAFGRGDLPAVLEHVADGAEWAFIGAKGLPYTGSFRGKEAIARWFTSIPTVDHIEAFEPREFMSTGEHVTVLGWERTAARPSGKVFESEWVHVFTVHDGLIVRFWGMYDTEASAGARG
jgi:ketosteroid isomerase-like protein